MQIAYKSGQGNITMANVINAKTSVLSAKLQQLKNMLHTIKRNIIQHHQKQQCMRYIIPYIQQTYITTTSNTKQQHQQEGPIPSIYTNIKENAISSQNVLL